jgi:hypothetical protein
MTMTRSVSAALLVCLAVAAPARAADDLIEKLVTCKESWYDNRSDEARMRALGNTFNESFKPHEKEHYFVPKSKVTVLGLPVVQAYPQSVGMGLGFSLLVDANFDKARAALEKATGKSLEQCETGDGMKSCELEVAEKRTLMVLAGENGRSKTTLLGCYYFYEK